MTAEGARHVYEKMAELPFDSFRKCMTVIVKDAEGVSAAQYNISSIRYLWVGRFVKYLLPIGVKCFCKVHVAEGPVDMST